MQGDPQSTVDRQKAWDRLHALPQVRLFYPSESVVRFGMRHFGHADSQRVILDMGCGGGRHSAFFRSLGHRVISLDHSLEGCRNTRSLMEDRGYDSMVVCGNMYALCLPDSSVDGALAYGVLYYTDPAGYRAAVGELWRVLRPGGHLLVQTRTPADSRFGRGTRIDDRTFVITDDSTNERGMTMHFLDRSTIPDVFAAFSGLVVDKVEETFGGGARMDSNWVIQLVK